MKAKEKERDRAEKRESKRGRNAPPGGIVSIPLFRFGRGTDHCRTPLSLVPCLTLPTVLHPLSFKKKINVFKRRRIRLREQRLKMRIEMCWVREFLCSMFTYQVDRNVT